MIATVLLAVQRFTRETSSAMQHLQQIVNASCRTDYAEHSGREECDYDKIAHRVDACAHKAEKLDDSMPVDESENHGRRESEREDDGDVYAGNGGGDDDDVGHDEPVVGIIRDGDDRGALSHEKV